MPKVVPPATSASGIDTAALRRSPVGVTSRGRLVGAALVGVVVGRPHHGVGIGPADQRLETTLGDPAGDGGERPRPPRRIAQRGAGAERRHGEGAGDRRRRRQRPRLDHQRHLVNGDRTARRRGDGVDRLTHHGRRGAVAELVAHRSTRLTVGEDASERRARGRRHVRPPQLHPMAGPGHRDVQQPELVAVDLLVGELLALVAAWRRRHPPARSTAPTTPRRPLVGCRG